MNFRPDPLTPADCDIRGFPFLPLECSRLRKSKEWLFAKRRPELGFYAVNLWTAAWHEVPAASLEDDDDLLAEAAMCDPARWQEVRADVLRNWIKCSDGRLYHETVAEKALQAWGKKRTQVANARKRWPKTDATAMPRHEKSSHGIAAASHGNAIEREIEKEREESSTLVRKADDEARSPTPPSRPKKRATACPEFDAAWAAWPQKGRSSKAKSLKIWLDHKGSSADKIAAARRYLSSKDAKKDGGAFVPAFERWIRDRLDSWLEAQTSPAATKVCPLPSSPDWWASVADRLNGYDAKFWRTYGSDLRADPVKRILFTESETVADRVRRRCEMLDLSVSVIVSKGRAP